MHVYMYLFTLHIQASHIYQRYTDICTYQHPQIGQSTEGETSYKSTAACTGLCKECEWTQRRQLKQTEGQMLG